MHIITVEKSYFKDCAFTQDRACELLERNKNFNYFNLVEHLAFFDAFIFKGLRQSIQ